MMMMMMMMNDDDELRARHGPVSRMNLKATKLLSTLKTSH